MVVGNSRCLGMLRSLLPRELASFLLPAERAASREATMKGWPKASQSVHYPPRTEAIAACTVCDRTCDLPRPP